MSKERARQRAKARAGQKPKKKDTAAEHSGEDFQAGKFDPGATSIKGPGGNANTKNFGGASRRSARSR